MLETTKSTADDASVIQHTEAEAPGSPTPLNFSLDERMEVEVGNVEDKGNVVEEDDDEEEESDLELGEFIADEFQLDSSNQTDETEASDMEVNEEAAAADENAAAINENVEAATADDNAAANPEETEVLTPSAKPVDSQIADDRLARVEHQLNDLTKAATLAVQLKNHEDDRLLRTYTNNIKKDQQAIRGFSRSLCKIGTAVRFSAKKASSSSESTAAEVKTVADLVSRLTTQVEDNTKAINTLETTVASFPPPQQAAPTATVEVVINDTTSKGEKVDAAVMALVSEAVNKAVNDIYEASADKVASEENTAAATDKQDELAIVAVS
uniref:uncharacterized protein LOC122610170 n=1 Tax=Erigeron canadensis TaxID=72917 RepID=UPI001CB8C991|nr:uncharacterized protein LOC122610170 [Erigeron canadensis]